MLEGGRCRGEGNKGEKNSGTTVIAYNQYNVLKI